ncbi:M56 family metallopeptidase [Sabulibacter ruber]|uniref:M56 family metallopeptidase n=1 Tax=Sabulibacter ruber TaxID=2811901 RepID=UPI001A9654DE|nr:M56 family metallopeptidase [Sabulibacter ruber]
MNEALLQYLLESGAGLILFFLFYALVLKRETSFQFNRFYLLAALFLSFLVPLSNLPGISLWPQEPEEPVVILDAPVAYVPMAADQVVVAPEEPFPFWSLLYAVYGLGVLFFGIRFLVQVIRLRRYVKEEGVSFFLPNGAPVFLTHGQMPTFSFWRWVFFDNSQTLTPEETERILQHEQVHIDQRHTLDVLLVSLAGILFWFNPLLVLYKRAVEQTHEFIADAHVAKASGTSAYSSLLVKQVLQRADFPLGSYFFLNKSLTLTRIKMMKKLHQSPRLSRMLMAIPVAGLLLVAVAAMRPAPVPESNGEKTTKVQDGPAQFPGGREALNAYVKNNLVLPQVAFQKRKNQNDFVQVKGSIEVEIGLDGTPSYGKSLGLEVRPNDPEVVDAIHAQFAQLVNQMPKWTPAQKDGKAVVSKETISVSSVSGNFLSYAEYLEGRQQKISVTTEAAKALGPENTKSGKTNVLPKIVLYHYPPTHRAATADQEAKASAHIVMPQRTTATGEKIYMIAEKMPQFPRGEQALIKFIANKFRIPAVAQRSEIEGTMIGAFVVSASGEVIRVDVVQSLSPSLDQELKRVLSALPNFTPGELEGKRVPVLYLVPFEIVAQRAESTSSKASASSAEAPKPTAAPEKEAAPAKDKDLVFIAVEQMPEFPGGAVAMMKYLKEDTAYPEDAKQANISGMMVASFVINPEGKVTDVQVIKKLHPSLDQAFVQSLQKMPNWKPGMQNGKAVSVKYTIPYRVVSPSSKNTSAQKADEVTVEGKQTSARQGHKSTASLTEVVVAGKPSPAKLQPTTAHQDERVFIAVQEMPEFPGGQAAMYKYFAEQVGYPEDAKKAKIDGTVIASFVITAEGDVTKVEVLQKAHPSLDQEFVKALQKMPKWKPGRQNGKAVNVKYTVPFRFMVTN